MDLVRDFLEFYFVWEPYLNKVSFLDFLRYFRLKSQITVISAISVYLTNIKHPF